MPISYSAEEEYDVSELADTLLEFDSYNSSGDPDHPSGMRLIRKKEVVDISTEDAKGGYNGQEENVTEVYVRTRSLEARFYPDRVELTKTDPDNLRSWLTASLHDQAVLELIDENCEGDPFAEDAEDAAAPGHA